jgi:hypothetical protein
VALSAPAFRFPRLENPEPWKKDETALESLPKVPSVVVVVVDDVDAGATLDVLDSDPIPESGLGFAGAFASSLNLSSKSSMPRSCHSIFGGGCMLEREFIAASMNRDVVRRAAGGRTGVVVDVELEVDWAISYDERDPICVRDARSRSVGARNCW